MTLSWTGTTVFRASAAGSGASSSWRFVLRTAGDGSVALGTSLGTVGTDINLGNFSVPSVSTTGHVDCLMPQAGRGLTAVRWNQS